MDNGIDYPAELARLEAAITARKAAEKKARAESRALRTRALIDLGGIVVAGFEPGDWFAWSSPEVRTAAQWLNRVARASGSPEELTRRLRAVDGGGA